MLTEKQIKDNFSKNLKKAREKCTLTDAEIAEVLEKNYGITLTAKTVNYHFNGTATPKIPTIYAYCDLFNVPADFLLFGTGEAEANRETVNRGEKTVPEILDALAVVLESFEMAIDLKEYEVEETGFFPNRATVETDEDGDEYIESAFAETKAKYYAIGINSRVVQKLLRDWKRKHEVVSQFGKDREQLTKLLFVNEVERAKQLYDAIDSSNGVLYKRIEEPIFINNYRDSIPYELEGFTLRAWQNCFLQRDRGGYEYENSYFPDYIPNRTRETVLYFAGCTEKSLDEAITTGDLSLLKPDIDDLPF